MIVGITGYIGSGKSTVAELLRRRGFKIVEMRDAVVDEMKKKGIEVDSKSLREFSTALRKRYGNVVVAKLTLKRIKGIRGDIAITGMRSTYEEAYFRKHIKGFATIAVVAPEKIRFERIKKRKKADDPKTLKEFREIEKKELNGFSASGSGHGVQEVIEHADYIVMNTGSIATLKKDINALAEVLKNNSLAKHTHDKA
ncbi:MAG: dephospho-CoA kinase [Candidatus Micrarchaeia archaeon]